MGLTTNVRVNDDWLECVLVGKLDLKF